MAKVAQKKSSARGVAVLVIWGKIMSKSKGNFWHNHPTIVKWLKDHKVDFWESNDGQHMKILGAVTAIELWPSRMTYHVLMSEHPEPTKYFRGEFNKYVGKADLLYLERLLNQ